MSLKSLSKTRWEIEPNRVVIYPFGLYYIFAGILAMIFSGLLLTYISYQNTTIAASLPLVLVILLIVVLFWGFATTYIEFDNQQGRMRKMFLGFLPVKNIPLEKLKGIIPVTNLGLGSYVYRLYRKDAQYGKGIVVSSGYGKNDDPNAVAFVNEAVSVIHSYLDQYDTPADFVTAPVTSYKYFDQEGGDFILKKNKIGSVLLGLVLLAIGIHELTPGAWLAQDLSIGRICLLLFLLVGGPAIILVGFTTVTLSTFKKTIEKTSPISWGNQSHRFEDFVGIQTVRKSMNLIYSGTEVHLYFQKPDTDKQEVMILQSFYRTSNVDRFIKELNSIMAQG